MKEKIGLVSPHHDPNYGTMLQAYALVKSINKLGYSAEYISYENFIRRNLIEKILYYLVHPLKIVNRMIQKNKKKTVDDYSFFLDSEFQNTIHKFEKFYLDNISNSSIVYNPKTIKNISGYSKFILGSDQTWSPHVVDNNSINFLDFVSDRRKKNAYAPSLGTINVPIEFQKLLMEKLSSFDSLSCRERKNCNLIQQLLNRDVEYVLDPTLLLSKSEWMSFATTYSMPEKYVLCYILGEKTCISEFAEQLGNKLSLPVYYIVTRRCYLKKNNTLNDVGPTDFLSLIANATYVVTDSFHGTIFSINFQIPFYTFTKRLSGDENNDNGRIRDILEEFGLEDCFCYDNSNYIEPKKVNYEMVQSQLDFLRIKSLHYLHSILS